MIGQGQYFNKVNLTLPNDYQYFGLQLVQNILCRYHLQQKYQIIEKLEEEDIRK